MRSSQFEPVLERMQTQVVEQPTWVSARQEASQGTELSEILGESTGWTVSGLSQRLTAYLTLETAPADSARFSTRRHCHEPSA